MSKSKPKKQRHKASPAEAAGMLSSVERRWRVKSAEYRELEREFHAARDELIDNMVTTLQSASAKLHDKLGEIQQLADGAEKLTAIIADVNVAAAFDKIKVDDPLMTQAEIVEQRRKWPDAHDIGKLSAKANMVTMIGGFARFDKRTSAQTAAAFKFLNLHEKSQIRSDRALDYAAPLVDGSRHGDGDSVLVVTDDARNELTAVRTLLGDDSFDLLVDVIAHCASARSLAGAGASHRKVGQITDRVRGALDRCAVHWRLAGVIVEEKRRVLGWDDGSPAVFTGHVVNPKPQVSR